MEKAEKEVTANSHLPGRIRYNSYVKRQDVWITGKHLRSSNTENEWHTSDNHGCLELCGLWDELLHNSRMNFGKD